MFESLLCFDHDAKDLGCFVSVVGLFNISLKKRKKEKEGRRGGKQSREKFYLESEKNRRQTKEFTFLPLFTKDSTSQLQTF